MRVLFLSQSPMESGDTGIYTDLLRTFAEHGHSVYALSPRERRTGLPSELACECGINIIRVAVGNITKTNLIEKGVSTLSIGVRYLDALKRFVPGVDFDLVLYATPPTTISGVVEKVKRATGARTYLLLKDIFPQNAIDLGMLSKSGPKAPIYAFFKRSERKTYQAADWIGCMSPANRDYLLEHEPWLDPSRVEVNPNAIVPRDLAGEDPEAFRSKYGLPSGERIFVYGGNLGKPQAIDFFIEVLRENEKDPAGFFLIAGSGTERFLLEAYFEQEAPAHAMLLGSLGRSEYDTMLCACNVGLVVLDHRFTIPNFPSRVLSYMQAGLPVVTATDEVCDMGRIAEANGFGVAGSSASAKSFLEKCRALTDAQIDDMGKRSRLYLEENYTSETSYELIMEHFNE
ncbi:glycosyltransferase family 4 protein [Collinsella sp. HCP3S3_D1]|uniref:glycosyltransferase family 4 protein n=1 Tax=Collinsella sp. HCP3S3_D1 TaxID=3438934 RepID=UPI003F8B2007